LAAKREEEGARVCAKEKRGEERCEPILGREK
jgi:hypothetical protein